MSKLQITSILTWLEAGNNLILNGVQAASTIIELRDHSLLLIDSGMFSSSDLVNEMAEYGYLSNNVSLIINTHLHPDHAGGNRQFPAARIIFSRRELEYEINFLNQFKEGKQPQQLTRAKTGGQLAEAWRQLALSSPFPDMLGDQAQWDYFEDHPILPPQVSIIPVPGHTIGSLTVKIEGETQSLLVSGDAYYHRDLGTKTAFPGINYSDRLFAINARRLAAFSGIIAPGHDQPFYSASRTYLLENQFSI